MLILFVLAHWGHHLLSSIITPLLPFIRPALSLDYAQAGWLVSAWTIAYGASQLPAGWLADRIGQRLLLALGISGVALCGVLVGLAPNYLSMLIILVFMGLLGGGYHPTSAPLLTGLVEPNRRGWILGIHQIGGTASSVTAPLLAAFIASYLGWQSAFIIPGVVVIVLGIVIYLLIDDKQVQKSVETTKSQGKNETGEARGSLSRLIAYATIGTAGQVFIISTVAFIALFMVDKFKESAGSAALILAVVYFGGMASGPLGGYFSDRIGAPRMLIAAGLITGPVIFLLNIVPSVIVSFLVLLSLGALMYVLMPVSEAYIINQTNQRNRSTVLGIYYSASRGGSGFLTPGLGYLIDRLGFYTAFSIMAAVILVIVAICSLYLWLQKTGAPGLQT